MDKFILPFFIYNPLMYTGSRILYHFFRYLNITLTCRTCNMQLIIYFYKIIGRFSIFIICATIVLNGSILLQNTSNSETVSALYMQFELLS